MEKCPKWVWTMILWLWERAALQGFQEANSPTLYRLLVDIRRADQSKII